MPQISSCWNMASPYMYLMPMRLLQQTSQNTNLAKHKHTRRLLFVERRRGRSLPPLMTRHLHWTAESCLSPIPRRRWLLRESKGVKKPEWAQKQKTLFWRPRISTLRLYAERQKNSGSQPMRRNFSAEGFIRCWQNVPWIGSSRLSENLREAWCIKMRLIFFRESGRKRESYSMYRPAIRFLAFHAKKRK